jgi:hypothetical protein
LLRFPDDIALLALFSSDTMRRVNGQMGVEQNGTGVLAGWGRGLGVWRRGWAWAFDLGALVLCLAVWVTAFKHTRYLTWPCENDLYRDLGAAQSILDGQGGIDPAYLGERRWYNPLVPALVAFASRVAHTPLHEAYARFGTELNLLAPIAFYALVRTLFNPGVALASLAGFLFLGPPRWPSWLSATYSPWLWPCNFAQGLFYLTTLVWVWAARSQKLGLAPIVGALMGLTLLAHAAPAMLLVGMLALSFAAEFLPSGRAFAQRKSLLTFFTLAALTSLLCAWPFLREWLGSPRRVQNPVPLTWVANELTLKNWRMPVERLGAVRGVLGLAGLVVLGVASYQGKQLCRHGARALLGWGLAASLALAYGYAAQRTELPPFIPSWHFYFYLQALESVLFGVGVAALASIVESRATSLGSALVRCPSERQWQHLGIAAAVLMVFVLTKAKRYTQRSDLVDSRKESIKFAQDPAIEVYDWLVRHSRPKDVVLAEDQANFCGVQPSGRKSVALPDLFSNPYVALKPRADAAAKMYADLARDDGTSFRALAREYRVHYVVLAASKRVTRKQRRFLSRVFSSDDREKGWDIYEIVDENRVDG